MADSPAVEVSVLLLIEDILDQDFPFKGDILCAPGRCTNNYRRHIKS